MDLLVDSQTIGSLTQTLTNTHSRLKVIATSKFAYLPRFTLINLGDWIVPVDPQERLNDEAKVVTLGLEGECLEGRISPLAACMHPFKDLKASSFSSICIEKLDRTPPTPDGPSDLPHPNLTWSMRTMVLMSMLVWIGALIYAVYCKETEAIIVLSVIAALQSLVAYWIRWRPTRFKIDSAELEALRKREKGDVMIFTENGALVYVKCSPQVAEELYFNFPTYETKGILPDLDDVSDKTALLFVAFCVAIVVGFLWEMKRVFGGGGCSPKCKQILQNAFYVTVGLEITFGSLPVEYRWDLSRYYWVDSTPKKKEKEEIEASKKSIDPTPDSPPRSNFDKELVLSLFWALYRSKDFSWMRPLGIAEKTGKVKEIKHALFVAGAFLEKFYVNRGRILTRQAKVDLLAEGGIDEDSLAMRLLFFVFKLASMSKREKRKRPDPSTFHINSVTAQLGLTYYPSIILKKVLEFFILDRTISWYPFSDPDDWENEKVVRVYSLDPNNPKRARFYYDIPRGAAEKLFSFPFSEVMTAIPDEFDQIVKSPKVFLHGTSIIQILLDFYGSAASRAADTDAGSSSVSRDGPPQAAEQQGTAPSSTTPIDVQQRNVDSDRGSAEPETEGQRSTVPPSQPGDHKTDTLFICADVDTHESRARAAKVGVNDRGTIDQLRDTHRSLFTGWLRIKRIAGLRFFRFHSFLQRETEEDKQLLIHIHKDQERYPLKSDPEYNDYRFAPRPWPAALPFPTREIFWYFLHPEDCGTSSSLNQMLPVRLGDDLVTHGRAFGIYFEELYSLWAIFIPVVVLSSLLLGATLWFIRGHTDDLQTAIVPFTVASSIGTLVINVAVSLLLFRMLAPS